MTATPTTTPEPARAAPRVQVRRLLGELQAAVPTEERKGDRGLLAALRRVLGDELAFSPEAARFVERFIAPEATQAEAEAAYLIAALFAHYPHHVRREGYARDRSLGRTLRAARFREGQVDQGVERRFIALLDAPREELPTHLRQIVQLLESRVQEPIDYEQLYWDVLRWEDPERRVQRVWAEAFWREERPPEATEAPE